MTLATVFWRRRLRRFREWDRHFAVGARSRRCGLKRIRCNWLTMGWGLEALRAAIGNRQRKPAEGVSAGRQQAMER